MRNQREHYGLTGSVQFVETMLLDISTKSYELHATARELWDDFGNPSTNSTSNPLLWQALKFDVNGRLIEFIDVERPLIEQEPYRYVYEYDASGRLTRKVGYREDGTSELNLQYRYAPTGKKVEEMFCSEDGTVQSSAKFDERENMISREVYEEGGRLKFGEHYRYEYLAKGEVLEQIYYPPSKAVVAGGISFCPPFDSTNRRVMDVAPLIQRTVYVHDKVGRVREQHCYDTDGSLFETKIADAKGVIRKKEWRLGDLSSSTTIFDERGREVEIHVLAKKGVSSPRDIDDRTLLSYDENGNMIEMVTKGPDGALVHRLSNVYQYDRWGNWIEKTETELNNTWKTEPFPAAFETVSIFHRNLSYF